MKKEIINKIKNFKDKNIIVLGDVMLDHYLYGSINRLNPEDKTVPLLNYDKEEYRLGGAANVAYNVKQLGGNVKLYGVIGKDKEGERLVNLCKDKNINFTPFYEARRQTTMKERILAEGQRFLVRIDRENKDEIESETKGNIMSKLGTDGGEIARWSNAIILSDYDKGIFKSGVGHNISGFYKENYKKLVLIDPKPANVGKFFGGTLICPNKKEAEEITGMKYNRTNMGQLKSMGKLIKDNYNLEYGVITCGEDGIFYYDTEENSGLVGATKQEVIDVTGAGDTVISALALCLASEINIADAVMIANCAAGLVVGKVGTSVVSNEELISSLEKYIG